jgi:hypothetical protein
MQSCTYAGQPFDRVLLSLVYAGGDRLVPRKVFYDFGLENIVKNKFFADPNWCALRGKGRSTPDDYYSSQEARDLHTRAGGDINDADTSIWALGLDFLQWYKSKVHSSGLITLRCEDLPHSDRSKLRYSQILVVIVGPTEPSRLDPYLEDTLRAFNSFSPEKGGVRVTENRVVEGVVKPIREFDHKMLLGVIYGDSPGIKKLTLWLSHSAYMGCGYCWFVGVHVNGAIRFLGHSQPTFTRLGSDTAYCGDPNYHLNHAQQKSRAEIVDQGLLDPAVAGCKGTPCLFKLIEYLDRQNTCRVPVPHAGFGVVSDLWGYLLRPTSGPNTHAFVLSTHARNIIAQRASHMIATCDFGRTYTDILKKRGQWTMEDWLHFTETWSVYLLMPHEGRPLLHPTVEQMWGHLRSGLLYFCRVDPLPDCAQTAAAAQTELKAYARLVEVHFGPSMCKFNLHLLICRLVLQERAFGRAAFSNEYWVENLIQWAKSIVKGRTTRYPELVLVQDMLIDEALAEWRMQHPSLMKWYDEWCPSAAFCGSNLDTAGADGSQLLGSGRALTDMECDTAKQGWSLRMQQGLVVPGWQPGDFSHASLMHYKHADVRGSEILHSLDYLRATSRQSYYMLVNFTENGVLTRYMARVLFFVKASAPSLPDLRVAVCELYLVAQQAGAIGTLWHTRCFNRPTHSNYTVCFGSDEMKEKHVMAQACKGDADAWFIPYRNMSGMDRAC